MVVAKQTFAFCSHKMPISIKYMTRLPVRCKLYSGITPFNVTKPKEIAFVSQMLKKSTFCNDYALLQLQATYKCTGSLPCTFFRQKCWFSSVCISTQSLDEKRYKVASANQDALPLRIGQNINVKSPNILFHKVNDVREHCSNVFGQHVRRFSTIGLCSASISWDGAASSLFRGDAVLNTDVPRRYKARPKQDKAKKEDQKEEDEDTDEEEGELEEEDSDVEADDEYLPEDKQFSPKFKEVSIYIKSSRFDAVLGAGLNISRSKIEDQFLGSKLRLNGKKVLKKGVKMEVGDVADLVISHVDGKMNVKRVRLIEVHDGKTRKDRMKVKMRAWRGGVTIDA